MGVSGVQILIIILVIAILFMGPSRIPGLGKSLGQAIRGFKKGLSSDDELDVTNSVEQEKSTARKMFHKPLPNATKTKFNFKSGPF